MTLPKRATAQSGYGGRGYRKLGHKGGRTVPSVTTVLKAENAPALVQWAVDQSVAYICANPQAVMGRAPEVAFKGLRFYWNRDPDALSADTFLNNIHEGVKNDAADLGTQMHEWMQADVTGTTEYPDVSNVNNLFWDMVEQWDEYRSKHTIEPYWTEATVWDEATGYAGTFDCYWVIDGKRTLIDIKTARGLYAKTWMQLAALYYAEELLEEDANGVDASIWNWNAGVEDVGVYHVRPRDIDHRGQEMAPFFKYVPVPGNLATHNKSFQGLLTYSHAQKELRDELKAIKKAGG